ncbi:hypothetical protein W97_09302 [Coniosporium apollinis CBS 100218]|uniref:Altered inheritance of mitochondria protein 6 n=1 Tax=Coniosporium apollinis (strain CBS 100218) TaxID=1168221 RepID=R7Z7N0_CONA1|nr:uncharacterized protein W97_09302 [Coniosporium apollinis CBS 100218]EON70034.1 hypothetical protein W97_09302 [Coniosporium apollinis CBS 100218]
MARSFGEAASFRDNPESGPDGHASKSSTTHLEDGYTVRRGQKRESFWRRFLMTIRLRRRPSHNTSEDDDLSFITSTEKLHRTRCTGGASRRICVSVPIVILAIFGLIQAIKFLLVLGPLVWDNQDDNFLPNWGQPGQLGEGLSHYATDFTRDVVPIPCHSHNDYWRRVPLFEAIHYGCTGVEADVWLFDDELFVGHNLGSLTKNRTLRRMYINPLLDILDHQNPSTPFNNSSRQGVFDEDPNQTLTLLIDFKTLGEALWPYVEAQLEPLRAKNYLTYYNGSAVTSGPITVVATGNAPFNLLTANSTYRNIFFDAPLASMAGKHSNDEASEATQNSGQGSTGTNGLTADAFTSANSYYASVSFSQTIGFPWRGRLSEKQLRKVRAQIQGAKQRGLKPRYWSTPSWPIGLRNHIWDVLVKEGVDYLNVDDLKAAARNDWRKSRFFL